MTGADLLRWASQHPSFLAFADKPDDREGVVLAELIVRCVRSVVEEAPADAEALLRSLADLILAFPGAVEFDDWGYWLTFLSPDPTVPPESLKSAVRYVAERAWSLGSSVARANVANMIESVGDARPELTSDEWATLLLSGSAPPRMLFDASAGDFAGQPIAELIVGLMLRGLVNEAFALARLATESESAESLRALADLIDAELGLPDRSAAAAAVADAMFGPLQALFNQGSSRVLRR